ncbi:MAG: beta-galactosidase [Verrucomicrobia bacterium Tous-C9LFEB]|nr:MAG: beta-galactosidase [Verrucomicrobia bacterium Tous-C9LFEB]
MNSSSLPSPQVPYPAYYSAPNNRVSLSGLWDFVFLGDIDTDKFNPADVPYREKALVPSAFDAMPQYAGKRGVAVYRRFISVPENTSARMEFEAVSLWCRVYIDGHPVREHACGYSPFGVDLPFHSKVVRELVVVVDNRFDFDRVPMHEEYFDFYQYGGIIRDVSLRVRPRAGSWVRAVRVTPIDHMTGEVEVEVDLEGEPIHGQKLRMRFDLGESELLPDRPVPGKICLRRRVPAFRIWSPKSPHLHAITITVCANEGEAVSEMTERFGIRTVKVRNGSLELNGSPLRLLGYNRHEWHPNFGPATPTLQMVADLEWLKMLGCNFVRGSHYPQDRRFLDLCDELGFLVWEENLGWGQREKTFQSLQFRKTHAESLVAMLAASHNHPSIIIRGFLNEAGTNESYVRPIFEESVATIRRLDPSRLVSYATMFPLTDTCYDLVDFISLNLYPGWYNCEGAARPLDLVSEYIRETIEKIDAAGWAKKPILISEIGAEGLYGWHDAHDDFFTEEYQAEYLRRACETALDHSRCCGIALWHFSDVRTYGGGWSLKRPRTFNNKGTLDEYRRPKLAYRAVREIFTQVDAVRPV